jgi:hypothetical protein
MRTVLLYTILIFLVVTLVSIRAVSVGFPLGFLRHAKVVSADGTGQTLSFLPVSFLADLAGAALLGVMVYVGGKLIRRKR